MMHTNSNSLARSANPTGIAHFTGCCAEFGFHNAGQDNNDEYLTVSANISGCLARDSRTLACWRWKADAAGILREYERQTTTHSHSSVSASASASDEKTWAPPASASTCVSPRNGCVAADEHSYRVHDTTVCHSYGDATAGSSLESFRKRLMLL